MQYNYHCNRVVILKLEHVQFWLFLAEHFQYTGAIVSNKKNTQTIYLYNRQYLRYNII
jgi:hypothetical protein